MLLFPKSRKFKKCQKKLEWMSSPSGSHLLHFGSFGLKALNPGRITSAQIEATRRVLIRFVRKFGHLFIRIFPFQPISQKPIKTRMGKGKGAVGFWVAPIRAGQILFEIAGSFSAPYAFLCLKQAASKLPLKTKIVVK